MEKIENNLMEIWKALRENLSITIFDIEELDRAFSNAFTKIQRQRERLETSRDMWESKYQKLKKRTKGGQTNG